MLTRRHGPRNAPLASFSATGNHHLGGQCPERLMALPLPGLGVSASLAVGTRSGVRTVQALRISNR